jgi:hypothetical protein
LSRQSTVRERVFRTKIIKVNTLKQVERHVIEVTCRSRSNYYERIPPFGLSFSHEVLDVRDQPLANSRLGDLVKTIEDDE